MKRLLWSWVSACRGRGRHPLDVIVHPLEADLCDAESVESFEDRGHSVVSDRSADLAFSAPHWPALVVS